LYVTYTEVAIQDDQGNPSPVGKTGEITVRGEMVYAFVALKPDAEPVSEAELLDFAKEHLADYKLPESITFIDTLPKGATGKIDCKLLKQYDKS